MTNPSQFAQSETKEPGPPLIAVGLVGLNTPLFEILLTRILSVTTWYHFSFVVISLALLLGCHKSHCHNMSHKAMK